MTIILHISDTHFGTEVPMVVEALTQAVKSILPDIIILSGDITQRARSAQFTAAAEFLASLPATTRLVLPGNHDIPLYNAYARFVKPYAAYSKTFGARESAHYADGVGILCLDATSPFRHTRGKLTRSAFKRQKDAIASRLKQGDILIVCAHQPLLTAWKEDADERLIGHDLTAQFWSEQGVDIVLSGHVHVPLLTNTKDVFPAIDRHFILAGAGTAVSHRIRPGAPNSFNLIYVENGQASVRVIPHVFDEFARAFFPSAGANFIRTQTNGWFERG